ncbi:hypothetical protein D6C98_08740 [Aureobasidium pullulans]|nr:hypothetical protein D6C98_08740 [Aureobasidium pullulans]
MPPKLVFKRTSQAGANGGGAGNSGGVRKPSSPKKSPTRSSNRLAGLPPDAVAPPATGPTYTLRDEFKETPEGASESSYKDGSHMWHEYVSAKAVDKEEWTAKTKWHGPSIRFVILEGHHRKTYLRDQEVYVNVAQPCYIGRQEEMNLNIGYLTGDSYARLMAAFDYRQHQQKVAAFKEYSNEEYTPANPMVAWPGDPKTAGGLQQERAAEKEKRMAPFYPRLDEGLDATKLVKKFELAGTK